MLLQDIDFDGFRRFLDAFLDCETPLDLAKHLFVSFLKPNVTQAQLHGKALNQMAAISSTAACAPVTSHTKGKSTARSGPTIHIHPYPFPFPFPWTWQMAHAIRPSTRLSLSLSVSLIIATHFSLGNVVVGVSVVIRLHTEHQQHRRADAAMQHWWGWPLACPFADPSPDTGAGTHQLCGQNPWHYG